MAAPGYDLYYLNVMAGPANERAWLICDDPAHAWIRDTWADQDIDPRLPFATQERVMTTRLTVAQAVVRFLEQQYVERDGVENAFFAGCWGIFGHGNVAGVGQALLEREAVANASGEQTLRYYQGRNEQAMVHAVRRLCRHARPDGDVRRDGLGRARLDQHDHRCRAGDCQPNPGLAAAR